MGQKRVALVIGISKYQHVPRLANPSARRRSYGFAAEEGWLRCGGQPARPWYLRLRRAIREFSEASRDADISVIYYAGHGIEVDGMNYLVPADAKLLSDFDIEDETVSLDRVLRALDPARRLKLIILDACRDNPFVKKMKRSVASRSIGRGLAKSNPSCRTRLSHSPRKPVRWRRWRWANSPFTVALLKHIAEPGSGSSACVWPRAR